ncbi:hypothetical protein BT96DRAFT_1006059 [Gymnopus androsaceus JB14]|uniref:BTB domain-containing protein n=1 Tax=Gymnopus androsaceus JB14 TaxID=1447944 RepID=A0A6A4GMG7_9AGAR|nr:hypothetical protein BT96DRAFT_1006059 [Gymnopus androsaceus JB14]
MEPQTFDDGDLMLRSADGVMFHIQAAHIPVACQTFPSYRGGYINTEIDASALETVLHFIYPSRALPNLNGISIDVLLEVLSTTNEWGMPLAREYCRFYFQQYVAEHPFAVLRVVEDCAPLLASLVPFILHVHCDTLMDLGVSYRLCVRWAIFREQSINAMTRAENILDEHDDCSHWRKTVKPHLKEKVRDGEGQLTILSLKKHVSSSGWASLSIQDVFQSTLEKIINTASSTHFTYGSDDEGMHEDRMNDTSDFINRAKPDASCCKAHLQGWRNVVVKELIEVQF